MTGRADMSLREANRFPITRLGWLQEEQPGNDID